MKRKLVGTIVAASMLLGSLSGCSLLGGGKDKEAISEVADEFVSKMIEGKPDKAAKVVLDEDQAFLEAGDFGGNEEIAEALLSAASYEIGEVEGKAKDEEGSAEIIFEIADLDATLEDGMTNDELIEAIPDAETTEDTFTLNLVYDDEEWFVDPDSATDFVEHVADLVSELEVGGLSEDAAIEAVEEFIGYCAAGDIEAAYAMTPEGEIDTSEIEADGIDPEIILPEMANFFQAYFGSFDYVATVTNVSEESIQVELNGTAPDFNTEFQNSMSDVDVLLPIFTPVMASFMTTGNEDVDLSGAYISLMQLMTQCANNGTPVPTIVDFLVTEGEDGELKVDPINDDLIPSIDSFSPDPEIEDELMLAILDQLLQDGTIDQDTYNSFASMYGIATVSDNGITSTYEEGTNFWSFDYELKSDCLEVTVRTYSYNNEGDVFEYDILIDGQPYAERATYTVPTSSNDNIIIDLPIENGELAAGEYTFIVYDQGAGNTDVVVTGTIVSGGVTASEGDDDDVGGVEPGSVVAGEYPVENNVATGTSMTVEGDTSTDYFTNYFYSDAEFTSSKYDNYSTNDSGIYLQIVTWDYHDVGDSFYYGVYRDGQIVDGGVSVIEDDTNDDDVFIAYEPSDLEAGDYTIIVYQVNSDVEMARAFVTVE